MLTNYSKFQNRSVQTFGFVYHDTNGQNHGPASKTQLFLLSEISVVNFQQDCYGKSNLRKSDWSMAGTKFQIGNVFCEQGLFLSVYVDDINLAGKKKNNPMCKVLFKEVLNLGEPSSFFDHMFTLGELKDNVKWALWKITEPCLNPEFPQEELKIYYSLKSSYFFMVLWFERSCKEVCGTILWVGKQDDSTTLQSIYSLHRWPRLQRRRNEICWRIATCMLSNCSEMLILGTNWTTWYSRDSK